MNTLALLLLAVLGAAVEIDLAPDQPMPYVYVDDPLIVELRADEDAEATVSVSVQAGHLQEPTEAMLGPFLLRGQGARWCAVRDIPHGRGFYTARVRVALDDAVSERTGHFCRIDRLAGAKPPPLYVCGTLPDARLLFALKAVAVNTHRIDAADPGAAEHVERALEQDIQLVAALDLAALPDPASTAAALAEQAGPAITRWEVVPGGGLDRLGAVEEALRESGSVAPLALVVEDAEAFRQLLNAGADNHARETVLRCEEGAAAQIRLVYRAAALAGHEEWRVHVQHEVGETQPDGATFARRFFTSLAAGADQTGFAPELVYDNHFRDAMAYLNGLAHRLDPVRYAGPPSAPAKATVLLFRRAADWLAVGWSRGEPAEITLPVAGAKDLFLTDALNNPATLPETESGALTLQAQATPLLLTGKGGRLLEAAAETRARQTARTILADPHYGPRLPAPAVDVVRRCDEAPRDIERSHFFQLLRVFPEIEREWHNGRLPQSAAVPAMKHLATLARALCTLEEAREDPFIEPLKDTLSRCEEYQSLYLTGSIGPSKTHERGDWLLDEVRRLMEEATRLGDAGRRNEANAVAALAEWRARGLESAAEAKPLTEDRAPIFSLEGPVHAPQPAPVETPDTPSGAPEEAAGTGEPGPDEETGSAQPEDGGENEAQTEQEPAETEPADAQPEFKELVHTVRRGDNPSLISRKYDVDLKEFMEWNGLTRRSVLNIGDKLIVRVPAGE